MNYAGRARSPAAGTTSTYVFQDRYIVRCPGLVEVNTCKEK